MRMDLDNISDEFKGQCHRSKVKVGIFKNMTFGVFDRLAVVIYEMSVRRSMGQEYGQGGHDAGGLSVLKV